MYKIESTYEEIIKYRKNRRFEKNIPPVLFYETLANGYILSLVDGNIQMFCRITEESHVSAFESNLMQFCNKQDVPTSKLIKTHDFSNDSTWIFGVGNSMYCFCPDAGKEMILHEVKGRANKNVIFGTGQSFHVSIWQSINANCPECLDEKTPFNDEAFNPGAGTGWLKVYPETNDPQEVSVYVYLLLGVPQYQVSDFKFESLEDFKDKANSTIDGNTYRFTYPYTDYGVYISLRSSKNERIEVYTSDDAELSFPAETADKSIICMVIKEYDEF